MSDLVWLVAGDSTGNGYLEWVKRLANRFAALLNSYYIDFYLFDDATKLYSLLAMLGRTSLYGTMTDSFDRADGALGTASSGGQTWNANSYTIVSGRAVPNAPSSTLVAAASLSSTSFLARVRLAVPTAGTYRMYFLNGSGRYVMVTLGSNKTLEVYTHDGTTLSAVYSSSNSSLVAGQFYDLEVVKDGADITVNLADVIVGRGTLSAPQDAALTGRQCYITSVTSISGHAWESYQVGDLVKPARRLKILNASISGTGFTYHTTNIAAIVPERPDYITNSIGHNEGAMAPADYLAAYETFLAAQQTQAGGAPVPAGIIVQNPETSPAVNAAAHNARMDALPAWAAANGRDYFNVYSAFNAASGGLSTVVDPADGVHTTDPTGNVQWTDVMASGFGLPPTP